MTSLIKNAKLPAIHSLDRMFQIVAHKQFEYVMSTFRVSIKFLVNIPSL